MDSLISQLNEQKLDQNDSTVVSFAGRNIKFDCEDDAMILVKAIEKCPVLTSLYLQGNTIGVDASRAIGRALESKQALKKAILNDIFTGRLKEEIPDALRFITNGISISQAYLGELDLSNNAFGPIGIQALEPFLSSESCQNLKILRFNNNGLGPQGGKLLGPTLSHLKSLEVFVCGQNRLENDAAIVIGENLACINTLIHLEMPQNGIKPSGIEALAKAIEANSNLEFIDLNDNLVKENGARALAPVLGKTKNLQFLNLGDCLIQSEGFISIFKELQANNVLSVLKELILNGNDIKGYNAVELILNAFTDDSITYKDLRLYLSNNEFTSQECRELYDVVSSRISIILYDDTDAEDYEENDESNETDGTGDGFEIINETGEEENEFSNEPKETINLKTASIEDLCENFVNMSIESFNTNNRTFSSKVIKKLGNEKVVKSFFSSTLSLSEAIIDELSYKKSVYDVMNVLLVFMGLMKSEEKFRKREVDLRGPFSALIRVAGRLPKTQKDVLKAFLDRPQEYPKETEEIKCELLKALHH